jgi:hypothetical protein
MKSDRTNDLEVDLLWQRDSKGYVREDHGKWGLWIGRRGGELVPIFPLRGGFAFKAFSNVSTPDELVEFMNHYGFLKAVDSMGPSFYRFESGSLRKIRGAPEPNGEDVREHLAAASVFREVMQAKGRRISQSSAAWIEQACSEGIGELQMVFDKRGALRPVLKPQSLMHGMFWQLIHSVRGGAQSRTCRQCGVIFEVGAGSGRRADAKFCSDEHKILFHSRRRSIG